MKLQNPLTTSLDDDIPRPAIPPSILNGKPCSRCRIKMIRVTGRLCQRCEQYANQDYGALRDILLNGPLLEEREQTPWPTSAKSRRADRRNFVSPFLESIQLSPQERWVFRLHFEEGFSRMATAIKLGISDSSVKHYLKRVRRKFALCHPDLQWVNTENNATHFDHESNKELAACTQTVSQMNPCCPRCDEATSGGFSRLGYCAECIDIRPE